MKKKILKRLTIVFISLIGFGCAAIAFACSDGFDLEETYYSFFTPETSHADSYAPFYRSLHALYHHEETDNVNDFNAKNIEEWNEFFKNAVTPNDLDDLLYHSRTGEIDSLFIYLKDKSCPCIDRLKKNSILKVKDKSTVLNFVEYLQYAKNCEPYATYIDWYWNEDDNELDLKKHGDVAFNLIAEGKKRMEHVKPGFIKDRYMFQLLRLYFISNKLEEGLTFYREQFPKLSVRNSMQYRIMGIGAGMLYKQKKYAEANYIYSLIYDQNEIMKRSAATSFHPQEETDWNACLNFATTTREKTVLWQLLGIYADPLRAMKEIDRLDPASELQDLLLTRAINLEEERVLPIRNSYDTLDTVYGFKRNRLNKELVNFISATAKKENTNKPYLWHLTAGYVSIMQGDYKNAEVSFANVKKQAATDSLVLDQVRAFELISFVEQEKKLDAAFESKLFEELNWLNPSPKENGLRNAGLFEWLLRRLSEKYNAAGEIAKAQCLNVNADNFFYADDRKIQKMITYMDKPNKTAFDTYIQNIYPYKKTDVFDLLATRLLYQYKFKEAIQKFEQCPGSGEGQLLADPFTARINDCHDCDFNAPHTTYTKLSFAKKMMDLQNKMTKDPANAMHPFELANGYYNMSYFGNARLVYQTSIYYYLDDYDWSSTYNQPKLWNGTYNIPKKSTILNCKKAQENYVKAMELATGKEFKAKCCFMAAKTEQNAFFISKPETYKGDFRAGTYFKLLKNSYSNTQYYTEVLNECGYFNTYINKK